ncbi:MAG: ferritin family protein [Candidatus Hodarchaeales archaeon]|jgi:rubrerythrin
MVNQDRIDFYKKQIELENEIVGKAENSVKGIQNYLIRELILSIALDSKKHAGMLNALISMFTKPTPSIAEEFGDNLKKHIVEHIQLEQQAINTYQEQLKTIDNESEKIIVKAILNDETKHHKLLKAIHKMIIENLTLSEEEFWDMVEEDPYRYIPYSD